VIALPDVNVLVALAWPNHLHHRAARSWFRAQHRLGWATCPTTQHGFMRVSSNSRVTPEARSPREAVLLLRRLIVIEGHVFWPEGSSLLDEKWVPLDRVLTHHQITDAQLLALALSRNGCLATFDRGIARLVPNSIDPAQALRLIPFGAS
jgi:toxin-antitoxin system PIN domain toxin